MGEEIQQKLERLQCSLRHGNLHKALGKIDHIESLIDNVENTYPKFKQLAKVVDECHTYKRWYAAKQIEGELVQAS